MMNLVIDKIEQDYSPKMVYRKTDKLRGKNAAVFTPLIDARLSDIQHVLSKFDLADSCLWSSAWFNEFTVHQMPRSLIFIEVEREAAEAIFYHLKDMGYKDVF